MRLTLRLIKPQDGAWFNLDVKKWVEEHPEYNKLIVPINKEMIMIKPGSLITIRRSIEAAGIVLYPPYAFQQVSEEKHAVIMEKSTGWYIKDVGSRNGTWIRRNDEFLDAKKEEIKLENEDKIYIGKPSDSAKDLNAIMEVTLIK